MDPSYNNSFGSFSSGGAGAIVSVPDSEESKSKKWVVILIVLLLLVGVGVGVFVLINRGDGNTNGFREIVSYIENVPEDYEWLEDDDYEEQNEWIYAVLISGKSMRVIQDYYSVLNDKYDKFLVKNRQKISEDISVEYGESLKILENAINYRKIGDELIDVYNSGGINEARSYFDKKVRCEITNKTLDTVCQLEMEYYAVLLQEKSEKVQDGDSGAYLNKFSNDVIKAVMSAEIKKMNAKILEELNA